ncbi:MAG: argininosuccinate lyase [Alphaproteobacteria bacterium]
MKHDLFLEEARLGKRNDLIVKYDEAPHLAVLPRRFRGFALVDLAHIVMLVEKGILRRDRGAKLLGGLLAIHDGGPERFPFNPQTGSYLVQVEHHLEGTLGPDIAGRIQTGRSRNDQDAAADRLFTRDLLLEVIGDILLLERALLARAREHAATVMPGYTHLQHAQPWTFGHYLMRQASIFERDLQRLRDAFRRTNLGVLGGAANAGTSWPLDRRRTAELLGHDGIVINSSDGGLFARDFLEEDVAVFAVLMSNLGRFATDFYLWSSFEFGFIEVADGLAGTSSIMPQKKNPHALERVKAVAGQAAGWLASMMGCQRGVCSTDLDFEFADNPLPQIGDATLGSLRLMTEVVSSLTVHAKVMAAKAGAFWSTASHLADELVRRFDLPFRTAHHVVGRFVKESIDAGLTPETATADALAAAARAQGAAGISLSNAELREILNARAFVESRATEGSVNPAQVRSHADQLEGRLGEHAAWLDDQSARIRTALAELERRARALANEA